MRGTPGPTQIDPLGMLAQLMRAAIASKHEIRRLRNQARERKRQSSPEYKARRKLQILARRKEK